MVLRTNTLTLMRFISVLMCLEIITNICNAENTTNHKDFKLTVVVLTMNRPKPLARLLKSIYDTDFESDDDKFDVEIHVDKSFGLHHEECKE